ncbi:thioredoxin family protein [Fructilactobacillus fructivorans]|uniref:Thioredoxin n=1 Tax=Fructilactobacillus fructivorans TaxID=1614 RepID=A0A0C1M6Z3_9LACO|nr:thioredoxin family protein [Fructilactobacillus fructivorans]KID42094.1 Thioredoxin [Fructilactobacillus fructivorans]KRK58535.1 Thiol-disulfide isomerase and thioredoxin [Fructilactobacillus fructivorans]KRN13380.1 Thiol-disulfide isomerase and thioredoxin [Fructilactobacillus fructivorans]KRN40089.1 Thiol-disulfide isomerase and thioredoxin [Fructilactobacillus fructivorans]KRN42516.1 Thiol-disulfide isomerase and thioredoxin [Fructilactobacillus fructivorans]
MEQLPVMNLEELKQKIKNGKYILFFSATWCPDCTFIKPAMPEIVKDFPNYKFIAVDRDDNLDLAKEMNIFGIPSFVAFDNGVETGRLVNKDRKTKAQVEDFIKSLPQ